MNKRVIGLTLLVLSVGASTAHRADAGVRVHENYGSNRVERDRDFDRVERYAGVHNVKGIRSGWNERFVSNRFNVERLVEKDRLARGDRSPTGERSDKLDRASDPIERRDRIDVAEKVERYEITYLT